MTDSGFEVPDSKRSRFTSYYRTGADGGLELADGPDGKWSTPPAFPLGSSGLTGTAGDWLAFGRMLLAGGVTAGGRRLLSADSVRLMTSDHTTAAQREIGALFLEGQAGGPAAQRDGRPSSRSMVRRSRLVGRPAPRSRTATGTTVSRGGGGGLWSV